MSAPPMLRGLESEHAQCVGTKTVELESERHTLRPNNPVNNTKVGRFTPRFGGGRIVTSVGGGMVLRRPIPRWRGEVVG